MCYVLEPPSVASFLTYGTFIAPPADTWYGWNDNRYCQTAPEQCIPSPYAINAVTCYLDSNGYVVGLKYYYTDGSLGGEVGYCSGASVGVNAGGGGVFVGVQTCKGAWGGYKSITWFNDCGDQVTCGNTRTDMNSWDYWGNTWNAPQPNKFVASWLNPDIWGQGYWNYFGGYQTQNTGFQSKFGGMFSKWVGFGGIGWGRRSLMQSGDEVATSVPTAEVKAQLEDVQAKAATFWLGMSPLKPNPSMAQTPPYWETCQYVNRYAERANHIRLGQGGWITNILLMILTARTFSISALRRNMASMLLVTDFTKELNLTVGLQ